MPYALSIGISEELCGKLTPRKLKIYEKAYEIKMKRDIQLVDGLAWNFCGNYVFYAVAMAVEKNLAGNKARLEYIKEPLMKDIELTEEEKRQKAIDEFVASINRMKANFDNSKKK